MILRTLCAACAEVKTTRRKIVRILTNMRMNKLLEARANHIREMIKDDPERHPLAIIYTTAATFATTYKPFTVIAFTSDMPILPSYWRRIAARHLHTIPQSNPITMPVCRCTRSGQQHEWHVQRRRGWCLLRKMCGRTKYRPSTNTPKPTSAVIGRMIYKRKK